MAYTPYSPSTAGQQSSQQAAGYTPYAPQSTLMPLQTEPQDQMGKQVVDQAMGNVIKSQLPTSANAGAQVMQKAGFNPAPGGSWTYGQGTPAASSTLAQPATGSTSPSSALMQGINKGAASLDNSLPGEVVNGIAGTTQPGQGLAQQGMSALSSLFGSGSGGAAATGATGATGTTAAAGATGSSGWLDSLLEMFM